MGLGVVKMYSTKLWKAIEEGCLRPYQSNFCCLGQITFQRESVYIGRLKNDNSHMIMILATVLLQNIH